MQKRLLEQSFSARRAARLAWSVVAALVLSVCSTTTSAPGRNGAFAGAASLAMANVATAFEVVERNYYQTGVNALVVNSETIGFPSADMQPFLTSEEVTARIEVLDGLKLYAQKLSEIMGNKQLDRFDDQTKAFGQTLLSLNKKKALSKKPFTDSELRAFATAVDTIGYWFIAYRGEKTVKQIVQDMKKPVHEICTLLSQDIGTVSDITGQGGAGLRDQVWIQYTRMIIDQNAWITHNKKKLDAKTRRAEIARVPALVREREGADAALAATQGTLSTLGETHDKLDVAFNENSPDLEVLVRQLGTEAERVKNFYQNLGSGAQWNQQLT